MNFQQFQSDDIKTKFIMNFENFFLSDRIGNELNSENT